MNAQSPPAQRLAHLDCERGLAVLAMVAVNALAEYAVVPAWAKHADPTGFTFVDLVAPMFVFVMGLSFALSFTRRRERSGTAKAVGHLLFRYGLLFFLGSLGTALLWLLYRRLEWNILQTLGVVGLVGLPVVFIANRWVRLAVSALWMILFQIALWLGMRSAMTGSPFLHSFLTSVGLASILVFAMAVSEQVGQGKPLPLLYAAGAALAVFGVALSGIIPIERTYGSLTYLLLGLGLSLFAAALFFHLRAVLGLPVPLLPALGRNALVLFMVSSVSDLVLFAAVPSSAPAPVVLLGCGAVLVLCVAVGVILDRLHLYVKL